MRQSFRPSAAVARKESPDASLQRVAVALQAGDTIRACRLLENEIRRAPASVKLRLNLAQIRQAVGDRDGAARELTRILRLVPAHQEAAWRLGSLLSEGRLSDEATIDMEGLAACLKHRRVDREIVGAAALHVLSRNGPLHDALAQARAGGAETAARSVLSRRSSSLLREPLLLAILEHSTVASREVEALLTALRRVLLLEISPARLSEVDLSRFVSALAAQCWSNGYVLGETDAERDRLASEPPPVSAVLAGDAAAGHEHLLRALYRDPLALIPDSTTAADLAAVKPRPFSVFLQTLVEERRDMLDAATDITRTSEIEGAISLDVKAQYESHPYPRWRGTPVFPNGHFGAYLESFFTKPEIAFLDSSFEVMIGGCGTGWQAVSAALDYGPKAHVTGLDISEASLGYAALMARRLEARNLSPALGDIERIATFEPNWLNRFHVVECCGVLHHMAEPFAAWRRLLDCLAPGGLMLIGLYSAVARRDLEILRSEPDYPGPGCDDDALRAYRQRLIARGAGAPGARYLESRDAFTTSGFRDFFLHVREQPTTIAEIAHFLSTNGLSFRGFVNVPFDALRNRFPDEVWPGRLDRWAALEAERPLLFIGMYQFWTTRDRKAA